MSSTDRNRRDAVDDRSRRGCRILFTGTGGQGVITAARLLTDFFVAQGQHVLSAQLHGMAQRGGSVQSAVLMGRGNSPAIARGGADLVIGFEPVETARALPYMSRQTIVMMDPAPIAPYVLAQNSVLEEGLTEYPDIGQLTESIRSVAGRLKIVDGSTLARQAGSVKSLNVVMLGCLFGSGLLPYAPEDFLNTTMQNAPARVAETNRRAFLAGARAGRGLDLIEERLCL